jgi:hypothetical protein
MSNEIKESVHIGVDCELEYFVTIENETLEQSISIVEHDAMYSDLTEKIDIDNFVSVISKIDSLKLYGEDKSNSEIFLELKPGIKKIFGIEFSIKDTLSSIFFFLLGVGTIYASTTVLLNFFADNKINFFLISMILPVGLYISAFLLMNRKIVIPNLFVKLPNDLKNVKGNYQFEITGTGLVQMFFDDSSEQDAKEKSKFVLGIEKNPIDETIFLTHFISIQNLTGVFLCSPDDGKRITKNLISPLRLKLIHSTFPYELKGWAIGIGCFVIPASIWNWIFG